MPIHVLCAVEMNKADIPRLCPQIWAPLAADPEKMALVQIGYLRGDPRKHFPRTERN